MNISRTYAGKSILGLLFGLFLFLGASNLAHAQTYYYPVATYQPQMANNTAQIQALMNQIYALVGQLQSLRQVSGNTTYTYTITPPQYVTPLPSTTYTNYGSYVYGTGRHYDTSITTGDFEDESRNSVTLTGNVRLDGAPYGTVWFEYGEDGYITEQSDDFRVTDNGEFRIDLDGLSNNNRYYYRAVVEDPSGNREYGSLKSFTTGNYSNSNDDDYDHNHNNHNNYDDEPDATTDGADSINSNSAEIQGTVSMNDFDGGTVFFVYGRSNDEVQDIENEDRYGSIYEDQQNLQKVQVDSDLDGTKSYWTREYGLDSNARYYYRICVGYDDNDDDDTLTCGDVESFRTNS